MNCLSPFAHNGFMEADGIVNVETGDIRCAKCGSRVRIGWPRTLDGRSIKDAANVSIWHGPEGFSPLDMGLAEAFAKFTRDARPWSEKSWLLLSIERAHGGRVVGPFLREGAVA